MPGLLTHENREIINACCLKLLSLWYSVMQCTHFTVEDNGNIKHVALGLSKL